MLFLNDYKYLHFKLNYVLLLLDIQENLILFLVSFLVDIDECKSKPCGDHGICSNSPLGSYTCSCQEGYDGDAPNCIAVNSQFPVIPFTVGT